VGVELHILSGRLKNRVIKKIPPINEHENYTPQVIKEAVFEILKNILPPENCQFIDLFSGSGQMSFEAYSRGYRNIIVYEKNPARFNFISNLIDKWNLEKDRFRLFCCDFELALKKINFNLETAIFIDPPYKMKRKGTTYLEIVLYYVLQAMKPGSLAIAQTESRDIKGLNDLILCKKSSIKNGDNEKKEVTFQLDTRYYGSQGILIAFLDRK